MNILVTGCAGFIGYNVCKLILSKKNNYQIFGIDNINKYYDVNLKNKRIVSLKNNFNNFSFNKIDIRDIKKLNNFFSKNKIKLVVHLAAQAGVRHSLKKPKDYIDNNIVGFYNVLESSKLNEIDHLIYASTSSVYGESKKFPLKEKNNTDKPVSFYAATKKCNEILAYSYSHNYDLKCTGLRFFTAYGPYGRPDMALYKFTEAIFKNKKSEIYNYGNHIRDFTYVDDVANYIYRLIKKPNVKKNHQIFNIASGKPKKLKEFIKLVEKYCNKKLIFNNVKMQQGDIYKTHGDISKISKYLNYRKNTSLEIGIQNFIKWYKEYNKYDK